MMDAILTYGGRADDPAGSSIVLVLELALVLGLDALLVAIPIFVARGRGGRIESIAAGAVLWGVIAAGTAGSAVIAEFKRARERMTLLLGGYDDPATTGDGPQYPWAWWTLLAALYVLLLVVAALGRRASPAEPTERPEGP